MRSPAAGSYYERVVGLLDAMVKSQAGAIDLAAEAVAASWQSGGRLLIAASAHSLHLEGVYRAGGPVAADVLAVGGEPAQAVQVTDVLPVDTVLVHSNAGTTESVVEVALNAREHGATVIALTQIPYETNTAIESQHPSGLKLGQVADITIDLGGDVGDAAIGFPGLEFKVAPTSSATGVVALWLIVATATDLMVEAGRAPLVFASVQLPGAEEHNRAALETLARTGVGYVPVAPDS